MLHGLCVHRALDGNRADFAALIMRCVISVHHVRLRHDRVHICHFKIVRAVVGSALGVLVIAGSVTSVHIVK
jgi:hypothetical protein